MKNTEFETKEEMTEEEIMEYKELLNIKESEFYITISQHNNELKAIIDCLKSIPDVFKSDKMMGIIDCCIDNLIIPKKPTEE